MHNMPLMQKKHTSGASMDTVGELIAQGLHLLIVKLLAKKSALGSKKSLRTVWPDLTTKVLFMLTVDSGSRCILTEL